MDAQEVALLASTAVGALSPYLSQIAQKTADAIVDKSADATVKGALLSTSKLWELVRKHFRGNSEVEKTLDAVAATPRDQTLVGELTQDLQTAFASDPDFAALVSKQLHQIAATSADVAFVNNIQGAVGKLTQFSGPTYGDISF